MNASKLNPLRNDCDTVMEHSETSNTANASDLLAALDVNDTENGNLRRVLLNLVNVIEKHQLCDDVAVSLFPDAKKRNGQPVSVSAKELRCCVNEAKQALSIKRGSY